MKKTAILKTPFTLETDKEKQSLKIVGSTHWKISAEFVKREHQLSLDESGEMFEPEYRLVLEAEYLDKLILDSAYLAKVISKDIKEIQTLFEFIEENKKNLFDELGFHGVIL
ncbi:hypothetical protein HO434_07505 [Streptococcus suis]|nr:hypothetical protein A7J10_00915 [Streptococcus suis]KPA64123.1 hypothetical protein XK27_10610 [Streptococcus suis]MCB2944678.1 hypothetical protein [Streptococcus suis]NQL90748.1 hypothetical protein [Streptococcus suis]HEM4167963.1 hypothetical protein [Streptococcus suis]